eukprot:7751818-Pyramimonas_sp.AAC.1
MLEAAVGQDPTMGTRSPTADASLGGDGQAEVAAGGHHAHAQFVGQRSTEDAKFKLRVAIASNKKVA